MTQEALKMALEALEEAHYKIEHKQDAIKREQAITAIKEALREHAMREVQRLGQEIEQEPVAWWIPKAEQFCLQSSDGTRPFAKAWEPLYTSPPQRTWVGLTDEQRDEICLGDESIARAIEAKLKELNT